jgi:hypothetical protein
MGGKGQSGKEEEKQSIELKLYGDMFNSECRTIMCLFDLTNTTIKLRQVDTIDKI